MTNKQLQTIIDSEYIAGLRQASEFSGVNLNTLSSMTKTKHINPVFVSNTNLYSKKELLEVKAMFDK